MEAFLYFIVYQRHAIFCCLRTFYIKFRRYLRHFVPKLGAYAWQTDRRTDGPKSEQAKREMRPIRRLH